MEARLQSYGWVGWGVAGLRGRWTGVARGNTRLTHAWNPRWRPGLDGKGRALGGGRATSSHHEHWS
jgi:hypothetical protein